MFPERSGFLFLVTEYLLPSVTCRERERKMLPVKGTTAKLPRVESDPHRMTSVP